MTKGLIRSLNRGSFLDQLIIKDLIEVDASLTVTGASGNGFASTVLRGMPTGNIYLLGASAALSFAGSGSDADLSDTWNGDFAVGFAPHAVSTAFGTDAQNIIASTAIGPASSEVIALADFSNDTPVIRNNFSGDAEVNLNLLIDDADIAGDDSVVTVTGFVHIMYSMLAAGA